MHRDGCSKKKSEELKRFWTNPFNSAEMFLSMLFLCLYPSNKRRGKGATRLVRNETIEDRPAPMEGMDESER